MAGSQATTQYNQNYGHENDQMNEQMSSRYSKRLAKDIQKKEELAFDNFSWGKRNRWFVHWTGLLNLIMRKS